MMKPLYILVALFLASFTTICFSRSNAEIVIQESDILKGLKPLKDEPNIMFWRPQKVGSSTVITILLSYAYRYNVLHKRKGFSNSLCVKVINCLQSTIPSDSVHDKSIVNNHPDSGRVPKLYHDFKELLSETVPYQISLNHQLCHLPGQLTTWAFTCSIIWTKVVCVEKMIAESLQCAFSPLKPSGCS